MKYIVELPLADCEAALANRVCKYATIRHGKLGWTYSKPLMMKFSSRKDAENAAAQLHGGSVVEVDA